MIPVEIILAFGAAFLFSVVLTPAVIHMANYLGLVDDARKKDHPAKTHKGVIPRAGGVSMFVAILVASVIFIEMSQIVTGVLIGAALIVIMGLLDDKFNLSPQGRLIMNFGVVAIAILFGLGVPFITNPFGGVIQLDQFKFTYELFGVERDFLIISNLFSLIWIVGIMNFVNWSSGVDGQMSGFVGISSIFLGLLALRFTAHDITSLSVAMLAFIVGGSFFGFLPWNFYPQKIMPGYSGSALGGFMLGVLSILSWGKIGTLILVLSVPLVDAVYIIVRRIRQGKSPLKGDAGHFHHRLLEIGWGRRRIAVFYWVVSFLFGISALFFQQEQKVLAFGAVVVLLALFIGVTNRVGQTESA